MEPRYEEALCRIYQEGSQTLNDFIKARWNQLTVVPVLKDPEGRRLIRREKGPVSNWKERPGNARPYHLTPAGERLAEEILAKKTGKMIVGPRERLDRLIKQMTADPPEIDGFTLPVTCEYDGKIVRDAWSIQRGMLPPKLKAWNRMFPSTLSEKERLALQEEVERNTFGSVVEAEFTIPRSQAGPFTIALAKSQQRAYTNA